MGQPFSFLEKVKEQIDPSGIVLEIGTNRGEGSTPWLWEFCFRNGLDFHTVDINPERCQEGKKEIPTLNVHCMKGEEFLVNTGYMISAAYLDNFDWIWEFNKYQDTQKPDWIHIQVEEYKRLGIEMNNHNSQMAHLMQSMMIENLAAERCIIIFDDTWKYGEYGSYTGKGGAAVPYLLAKRFEIIEEGDRHCKWVAVGRNINV